MRFSLNLADILLEMGNEYGETFEDLGIDWRKVADMLVKGKISFRILSYNIGDYLVIDIPDEMIENLR